MLRCTFLIFILTRNDTNLSYRISIMLQSDVPKNKFDLTVHRFIEWNIEMLSIIGKSLARCNAINQSIHHSKALLTLKSIFIKHFRTLHLEFMQLNCQKAVKVQTWSGTTWTGTHLFAVFFLFLYLDRKELIFSFGLLNFFCSSLTDFVN